MTVAETKCKQAKDARKEALKYNKLFRKTRQRKFLMLFVKYRRTYKRLRKFC